ncbi:hypothetical protein [Photobacterium leiognathi]|uniref:hypothetical protein n=1 Tax=Photobacterium leiognathi TaxID=553611 RepID=UPI002981DFD1|nr:hypothetical protein [Photobacterium leiognathi]
MNNLSVVFYGSRLDRFNRFKSDKELLLNVNKEKNEVKLVSMDGVEFIGSIIKNTMVDDFNTIIDGSFFDKNFCQYQIEINEQFQMNIKGITHANLH